MHSLGPAFAARAAQHDTEDTFVAENYAELKRHKFFSLGVPSDLGGGGASYGELCEMLRELAHYCPSTALALSMHQHLLAAAVWRSRQGQPGEALLRRIATEDLMLVSTGGRDWLASSGEALKVAGGFRVSARKPFASGCEAGDLLMTNAPYNDPEMGPLVLHFPLSMRAEGSRWTATGRHSGCAAPARTRWCSSTFLSPMKPSRCAARAVNGTRCGTSS